MSENILIVDDDSDWLLVLSALIRLAYPSVSVRAVQSLSEAMSVLANERIGFAIIDIRLDERDEDNRDGLKLLDFIRQNSPDTNSLLITGYPDLPTVKMALHPAADGTRLAYDFILKSAVHTELPLRLQSILISS